MNYIKASLQSASIGEVSHGIYFKGDSSYKTVFGGRLAIIGWVVILIYAISILKSIFNQDVKIMTQRNTLYNNTTNDNFTENELMKIGMNNSKIAYMVLFYTD
jgi:hypothetical protein